MPWVLLLSSMLGALLSAQNGFGPRLAPRPATVGAEMLLPTRGKDDAAPGFERRDLLPLIATDFKNVFTRKENLVIVTAGLGAAWGASQFDEQIAYGDLNSEMNSGTTLDHFFEAGEILGSAAAQVGGAFGTYGLGKLLSDPGLEDLGRDLVRSLVLTQSLTFALKLAVSRERPDSSNSRSFPSGHASGSFATATVLQRRYGWKAGVPAYALACYVATSRLNEGRHYLSDVVFGAALGIMSGHTVTLGYAQHRVTASPLLRAGGFGVQLAWFPTR